MGNFCTTRKEESTSDDDDYEDDDDDQREVFSPTPAPVAVAAAHGGPAGSERRGSLASNDARLASTGGSVGSQGKAGRAVSQSTTHGPERPAGNQVHDILRNHPQPTSPATPALPVATGKQLNPLQADNDCTDTTGRQSPEFEAPGEDASSPAGIDGVRPQFGRSSSSSADSSNVSNSSSIVAVTSKIQAGGSSHLEQPGIANEPYDVRISKTLQNKFIRGLSLVKVNEGVAHPFVSQFGMLLGAMQDLKGERLRQSHFSLQQLSLKAEIVLRFRVSQNNELFNAALVGKNGVFIAPEIIPGDIPQESISRGFAGLPVTHKANRSILYAAACGIPYLANVLTQYLPVQAGRVSKRKLESEIHVTRATSTVAPTAIRKGRKCKLFGKYDREALMWMTSGTQHAASFVHTLLPDALMNLDLIETDLERAPAVAAKMTLMKLYDVAKDRAFAHAALHSSTGSHGESHASQGVAATAPEFFRIPNVELSLVYIRDNMLYSSTSSGFAPPSVFVIHADKSFPEIVELCETESDIDDTQSVQSFRSSSTASMSSTGSSRFNAPKMRYEIPPGTGMSVDLGNLVATSAAEHPDASTPPLLAVVIATPTFWNAVSKHDVAEMVKCMMDLDKSVLLRAALSNDVAPLIRKYRMLRHFVRQCEVEQKYVAAHEAAAAAAEAAAVATPATSLTSPPHGVPVLTPVSAESVWPRRLRNMNQDMCDTLRSEAVLRCGKDKTCESKCAVSLLTIRIDTERVVRFNHKRE